MPALATTPKTVSEETAPALSTKEGAQLALKKARIRELLVREGYLTDAQVEHILTVQKTRHPAPPFGELCIELGLISPSVLGKILSKHHVRIPLGELLIHLGLVTPEQVQTALSLQKKHKKRLGSILVEQGHLATNTLVNILYQQARLAKQHKQKQEDLPSSPWISPQEFAAATAAARDRQLPFATILMEQFNLSRAEVGWALSMYYKCPFVEYNHSIKLEPELLHDINPHYLKANAWIPLRSEKDWVEILTDDPYDFDKTRDIKRLFPGKQIHWAVGLREDVVKYVTKFVSASHREQSPLFNLDKSPVFSSSPFSPSPHRLKLRVREEQSLGEEASEESGIDENDSHVISLVNQILTDAITSGVSDIHIEPYGKRVGSLVRFRIDGVCHEHLRVLTEYHRPLISRLKIMARLDIAERRKPQDGKLKFRHPEKEVELRMATLPTANGEEDVVLRLFGTSDALPLQQLNLTQQHFSDFTKLLANPHGMILCVGPTGSGKTTTLHAALGHINTPGRKIWTAEDPVEIIQPGLRQVQVAPKIGFTFASAMRSFLRADPDVIMVGEIRDQETADVTIEAALTGHLVLSTLHTNSAPETITRLLDMGIDPFSFADALLGVLAQRLARMICQSCKVPFRATREEYEALAHGYGEAAFMQLGIPYSDPFMLYRGKGCPACLNTGYRGRIGLHELLVVSDDIRPLIHSRAPVAEVRKVAQAQGMTTLIQDGVLKVLSGWTDYTQVKAVAMR
jgi:type II secretory ATPase GspE/PulE/Tfp pilus assembly ATPase PilB-like protein